MINVSRKKKRQRNLRGISILLSRKIIRPLPQVADTLKPIPSRCLNIFIRRGKIILICLHFFVHFRTLFRTLFLFFQFRFRLPSLADLPFNDTLAAVRILQTRRIVRAPYLSSHSLRESALMADLMVDEEWAWMDADFLSAC